MNAKIEAATKILGDISSHSKQTLESLVSSSQAQAEKISTQVLRGYDEMSTLGKQNMDALMTSSSVVAKGAEEASRSLSAFARTSMEQTVSAGKAMLGIKTIHDLVDLQTRFAKTRMDAFLAESSALAQLSVKVSHEAMAPIKAQVSATMGKAIRPAVF